MLARLRGRLFLSYVLLMAVMLIVVGVALFAILNLRNAPPETTYVRLATTALSVDLRQILGEAATAYVESPQMFRPWVVSMILSVSSCERQKVKSGLPVLDMKLATHARERGLKVVGLETIESQLGAMAGIPDDQQLAMLRASLKFANRSTTPWKRCCSFI